MALKFVLDENISLSLYKYLKSRSFNVMKVGQDTPPGITDKEVFELCVGMNAVLITRDCGDFGELIHIYGFKPRGMICLKGFAGTEEVQALRYILKCGVSLYDYITVLEKAGDSWKIRQSPI